MLFRSILCHPLLLLSPIPPSIRVFSNKSTLRMRWPKYWSFSFSINPSSEHPGLISFRMDWLDLLAVQETLTERPLPPPVSLASQSHHEKPPEVTCTSRGNPGFPASTRESTRETFFNTSRGQIPLPWLGSNDALPLATSMETRLPWRPREAH